MNTELSLKNYLAIQVNLFVKYIFVKLKLILHSEIIILFFLLLYIGYI